MLFSGELGASWTWKPDEPLQFVGIEASAYAVSKSLVLWKMLQQTPTIAPEERAHLRSIGQVWFSTTWEPATTTAVKVAFSSLCTSEELVQQHADVQKILNHWRASSGVSLQAARKEYVKTNRNGNSYIGALKRKSDRMAYTTYELTGDFLLRGGSFEEHEIPTVGNMIRFDCPEETPPLLGNETVFSVLSFGDIASAASTLQIDICKAAENVMIDKSPEDGQVGTGRRNLICSNIESIVAYVAKLQPNTMSWSNILDYMSTTKFHNIARACSDPYDTLHFGYSMNWVTSVFGNILDFRGPRIQKFREELLVGANEIAKMEYVGKGWDAFLRIPIPQNAINTTATFVLEKGLREIWAESFTRNTSHDCGLVSCRHLEISPLSPGDSTISLSWSYD